MCCHFLCTACRLSCAQLIGLALVLEVNSIKIIIDHARGSRISRANVAWSRGDSGTAVALSKMSYLSRHWDSGGPQDLQRCLDLMYLEHSLCSPCSQPLAIDRHISGVCCQNELAVHILDRFPGNGTETRNNPILTVSRNPACNRQTEKMLHIFECGSALFQTTATFCEVFWLSVYFCIQISCSGLTPC